MPVKSKATKRKVVERGQGSGGPDDGFVNDNARQNYRARFANRPILGERGFELDEQILAIASLVAARNLGHWLKHPTGYHPDLMREFYAIASVSNKRVTYVRGKEILFTLDKINDFIQAVVPESCDYVAYVQSPN
jgi:hypothetical protein